MIETITTDPIIFCTASPAQIRGVLLQKDVLKSPPKLYFSKGVDVF